eukprot:CAMPEP_0181293160 /NCGR_PEP_ID=MMETSP1101-20121128/2912_1 /TAXON_ID=46948 /ORGANISM="Rhodomonas abbreviata, Strain Caron Lab Isolate" /LENGTH=617 /DNA_ID=CAMNT_0023397719 /DNA_START=309 /DNA_END=2162 /DNA_ORIENTATION=-
MAQPPSKRLPSCAIQAWALVFPILCLCCLTIFHVIMVSETSPLFSRRGQVVKNVKAQEPFTASKVISAQIPLGGNVRQEQEDDPRPQPNHSSWSGFQSGGMAHPSAHPQPRNQSLPRAMAAPSNSAYDELYTVMRRDPLRLTEFIAKFPKGGELHSHWQGAISPRELLDLAKGHSWLIDPASMIARPPGSKKSKKPGLQDLDAMAQANEERILRSWSILDFKPNSSSSRHFFSIFERIWLLSEAFENDVIASILARATVDRLAYVELMANPFTQGLRDLAGHAGKLCDFNPENLKQLPNCLHKHGIKNMVGGVRQKTDLQADWLQNKLGYQPFNAYNKQGPVLRFLYQVPRAQDPASVMTKLYFAFLLVHEDDRFVGVNLVQQENSGNGLRDYDLHMRMLIFLKEQFPDVPVSLHAGELGPNSENAQQSREHIRKAITIGGAKRIGHGVNIHADPRPNELLELMASKNILVEVSLSSNDFILGVRDRDHPLRLFLKHRVPVALSTDDAGVLRTSSNREFFQAVVGHKLSYSEVKQLARNSLTFSFLQGVSLWDARPGGSIRAECKSLRAEPPAPDAQCLEFLQSNPKAHLEWKLEEELSQFDSTAGFSEQEIGRGVG